MNVPPRGTSASWFRKETASRTDMIHGSIGNDTAIQFHAHGDR
jgi:hypothetical protein